MAEQQIYKDGRVEITTKRVVVGGNTYVLQTIVGIRVVERIRRLSLTLSLFGGFSVLVGCIALAARHNSRSREESGAVLLILGLCCVAIVFWLGFWRYFLYFDTSSGPVSAFKGKMDAALELRSLVRKAIVAGS